MERYTPSSRKGRRALGAPVPSKEAPLARTVRATAKLTLVFLLSCLSASAVAAQEGSTFSAALLGTLGGSLDAEPGDDLSNTGFQVNLGMWTEPRT